MRDQLTFRYRSVRRSIRSDMALQGMSEALNNSDVDVRLDALEKFSGNNMETVARYAPAVIARLEDDDARVRTAALKVLRRQTPEALAMHAPAVIAKLNNDVDESVRTEASKTLARLDLTVFAQHVKKLTRDALVLHAATVAAMLKDPIVDVRQAAMQTLDLVGQQYDELDQHALEAVAAMLKDPDEIIKTVAFDVLSNLDPETLITHLKTLENDSSLDSKLHMRAIEWGLL